MNIINTKFGRLTVIKKISKVGEKNSRWLCQCECGKKTNVNRCDLITGNTKSCGCYAKDSASKRSKTHGMSSTVIYARWRSMLNRCRKNYTEKVYYHDKGIEVSERWRWFENFYHDMHKSFIIHSKINGEKNTTIERIDSNKGYSKENCMWATIDMQNANKKSNRKIMFNGEEKPLFVWCKKLGLKYEKTRKRLNRGWSIEDAFATTVR